MVRLVLTFLFLTFSFNCYAQNIGRYIISNSNSNTVLVDTITGKTWILNMFINKDQSYSYTWNPAVFSNGKQWTLIPPD